MREKHAGGRGRRTEKKYDRLSVTMHPDLREALDALAKAQNLNRSEALEHILEAFFADAATKAESGNTGNTIKSKSGNTSNTAKSSRRKTAITGLPESVRVLKKQVPRGIKWKPEKYAHAEELLSQGEKITRIEGSADYQTATGAVMSWRTVAALIKRGVLA